MDVKKESERKGLKMKNKQFLVLMLIVIGLLLLNPVNAKIVETKVDDKGVIAYGTSVGMLVGAVHTEYGWITVSDDDYNNVEINDTIRYDTYLDSFWMRTWDIEVIE